MIKIAICIPTYNRASTISYAIDSLLTQTKSVFDVHIFDNCSTDNTQEIINASYAAKVFYHKNDKNIGFVGNMNKCLSISSNYDWIGILHSDDTHIGESISEIEKYFNYSENTGIIFSECNIIDKDNNIIEVGKSVKKIFKSGVNAIKISQSGIPCSSTFYNSSAIKTIGLYDNDFPYSADEEYNNRLAEVFDIVRINSVIANHRIHANNFRIETWLEPDFVQNYYEMRHKMLKKSSMSSVEKKKFLHKYIADTCLVIGTTLYAKGYKYEAKNYIRSAFNYYPFFLLNLKSFLKAIVIFSPVDLKILKSQH